MLGHCREYSYYFLGKVSFRKVIQVITVFQSERFTDNHNPSVMGILHFTVFLAR